MKDKLDVTKMTSENRAELLKSQQGELDAVILYRRLAKIIKESEYKETFLKMAADEGKHAVILKKYTGETLKPKTIKAILVVTIYKVFGLKFLVKIISKNEFKAAIGYSKLAKEYNAINEIIEDEKIHGELMKNMY